ncbi:HXXEE domain-containing protein [Nonomuraea sp. NPDC049504]|uniref:HXXEE domain-containing protein n=1 Tax=Nonomuraea sp. NPDC049504 TaxID=3154729 RepID=UPI00344A0484
MSGDSGRVPAGVAWGLLGAWVVHDAEELVTMARWTREARPLLESRFPGVPWERLEVSQAHAATAIGLMGAVVAGAAAMGARTGGHSPSFQTALAGFGVHGVVHLAQAALFRGYTPGVVTAPLVVLPYAVWAWRRLRAAGVPTTSKPSGLLALPLVLAGVHALAHALTSRRPSPQGRSPWSDRPLVRLLCGDRPALTPEHGRSAVLTHPPVWLLRSS